MSKTPDIDESKLIYFQNHFSPMNFYSTNTCMHGTTDYRNMQSTSQGFQQNKLHNFRSYQIWDIDF
jgi:hypothetical protein